VDVCTLLQRRCRHSLARRKLETKTLVCIMLPAAHDQSSILTHRPVRQPMELQAMKSSSKSLISIMYVAGAALEEAGGPILMNGTRHHEFFF